MMERSVRCSSSSSSANASCSDDDAQVSIWQRLANPLACCLTTCGHRRGRPQVAGSPVATGAEASSEDETSELDVEDVQVAPVISSQESSADTEQTPLGQQVVTKLTGDWDLVPLPAAPQDLPRIPSTPQASPRRPSLLTPALLGLEAAVAGHVDVASGRVLELDRVPLIEGLVAYAQALDALGGGMGGFLQTNIDKLRKSKADASLIGFREWMLSELPVHAANGYRGYVDDSAWMANLWVWWTMEFFVEFFAQLYGGLDTKPGADVAYKRTLYNHHNFIQRAAFSSAVGRLPSRQNLLQAIRGDGGAEGPDVLADMSKFVEAGRLVVLFLGQVNSDCDALMKEARILKR
mmetsp:Transcript_5919/g.17123  ORF Transcript_5919/g.17123 Transcript_5919/m.17123 type:complete len:350 (+) Transcript_5919:109-1158(+)